MDLDKFKFSDSVYQYHKHGYFGGWRPELRFHKSKLH
jgi:hypothetical protein